MVFSIHESGKLLTQQLTVTWIGTVNGAGNKPPGNNTVKDENYIDSTSPYTGTASPLLIITYAELKFIEAEAALATDPRAHIRPTWQV